MNNYKELIQVLLQSGWLTKEQFKQYRKYQNAIIDVLVQQKIVTPEQIKKAQHILQNKTRDKYDSLQMQDEFSNLQETSPKPKYDSLQMQGAFSNLKNKQDNNSTNTKESIAKKSHPKNIQENDELTRYSVKGKLGSGGMGIVYQAYDNKLKRDVALKVLQQEGSNRKIEQFEQEARLMAKLDHPNIVKVFDFGHRTNKNYFTMELIQGKDFASILHSIHLQQSLVILMKSCLAVHYAHQQGVIHRDLKPANIMVSVDYEPKVMDFGLAREKEQKVSQSMAVEGTPQYMSPEQTTGKIEDLDTRSDVYSLGVILYEILTGDVPFKGKGKNNIFVEILTKEAKIPSKIKPSISKELEAICLKCLEKDRNMRYRTAKQLAEDIENYLQNRPITAKPATLQQKIWKWSKRNKPLAITILISSLVLMMFFTWSWYQVSTRSNELTFISQQEQDTEILRYSLENCVEYQQRMIKALSALEASLANIRSNFLLIKNNMESNNVFVAKNLLQNKNLQSYENGILQIQQDYNSFSSEIRITEEKAKVIQEKINSKKIKLEKNRQNKLKNDLHNINNDLKKLQVEIIAQLENAIENLFENLSIEKTITIQTFKDLENILIDFKNSILATTENFYYSAATDFYNLEKSKYTRNKLNQFSAKYTFDFVKAELIDLASNTSIRQFKEIAKSKITEAAFSPKDTYFVVGNMVGEIEIYNMITHEVIQRKIPGEVDYFQFSINEKYLFFSVEHAPYLLFFESMKIANLQEFQGMKYGFFSHDNKYLGLSLGRDTSYYKNITPILDIENIGTENEVYAKIDSRSYALAFDKASKYVYLGDLKSLVIYDLKNKQIHSRLENAHSAAISSLDVSFDNNYVATYGKEGIIKIRNTNNYNMILSSQVDGYISQRPFLQYENNYDVSLYTQDYKTTFKKDDNIQKLDITIDSMAILRNETTTAYNTYKNHIQSFTELFVSSDKRYLCSYIFPVVSVWDLQEKKLCYTFSHTLYENSVNYLDMSFDNRYLLVLQNIRLKIVDLKEKKIVFDKEDRRGFRKVSRFYPETLEYTSFQRNNGNLDLIFTNIATKQKFAIQLASIYAIQDISFHKESQKVFISRVHTVEVWNMKTRTMEKSMRLDNTQKVFECISAISEDTFAGGTDEGEFILYSFQEGILASLFVYNEIEKIKYDAKEKRFWIFAQDRIFIYSLLEKKAQDFFQLLYPITILEGYNILSADINDDFTKLYVMLTSGVFEIDISNVKLVK